MSTFTKHRDKLMAHCCLYCFGGRRCSSGSKARRTCLVIMAILASPSKAFLPALSSPLAIRRLLCSTTAALNRHSLDIAVNNPNIARQSSRASYPSLRRPRTSLPATADGAKDAAMAAVQAAEEALSRAAEDAGSAAGAREVRDTVAAARAAAQNAMDSLRRDEGEDIRERQQGGDAQESFRSRQDRVTLSARSAVQAALSAVAEAQASSPSASAASSTAAKDAIGMVQAALDRRDAAAAELGVDTAGQATTLPDTTGSRPREDGGHDTVGDGTNEGQSTKEPGSAIWSRNNPAASHSQMAHLLWRQVAGPGDTVLDCTAGNGYDSVELAKAVALKDGLGSLYIMDVQERALEATRERLESELGAMALKRSTLINGNFREMPPELEPASVQLIVYNLGWLPGGDKSITTKLEDTLESIEAAKPLLKNGGMISVMLYRGHAEGKREAQAVLEYAAGLAHNQWRVFVHERINRSDAPELLTMFKL